MSSPRTPDASTIRRLAVEADVDPRSIHAVLRGRDVRGMAGRRARDVLVRHGFVATHAVTPQEAHPTA